MIEDGFHSYQLLATKGKIVAVQNGKLLVGVGIAAAVAIGAACYFANSGDDLAKPGNQKTALGTGDKKSSDTASATDKTQKPSNIGSILGDSKKAVSKLDPKAAAIARKIRKDSDYGRIQPVSGKGNPAVKSVDKAMKTGKNLDQVTAHSKPAKKFDTSLLKPENAQAYKKYLSTPVFGRIYQTAKPGKKVPVLRVLGKRFLKIKPGETVTLSVVAAPNAPVTFGIMNSGSFKNGLNRITVKADSKGRARTEFTATPGAKLGVLIKVACPLASGNKEFLVDINKN